jgi:hypothetical protein
MTIGFGPKKSFKSILLSVRESPDSFACRQYGYFAVKIERYA